MNKCVCVLDTRIFHNVLTRIFLSIKHFNRSNDAHTFFSLVLTDIHTQQSMMLPMLLSLLLSQMKPKIWQNVYCVLLFRHRSMGTGFLSLWNWCDSCFGRNFNQWHEKIRSIFFFFLNTPFIIRMPFVSHSIILAPLFCHNKVRAK